VYIYLAEETYRLSLHDQMLVDFHKENYNNSLNIIDYIKEQKAPSCINIGSVTLFALYDYFQREYVLKPLKVYEDIILKISHLIPWESITIVSKMSNFPHLIGVKPKNDNTILTHSNKVKLFLDGVMYRWILFDYNQYFCLDFEKIEVFSWIKQTLSNPTYILTKSAIRPNGTKICADLFFMKRILNSDKYCFHIVALKNEDANNFAFVSQFAIEKDRLYRVNTMFDVSQAIYSYKKPR